MPPILYEAPNSMYFVWIALFGTAMLCVSLVFGGDHDHDADHSGGASSLLQTVQQLGGAIGLAVIASVYASQAVPGQFVPGFGPALLTCSGFALLSVLAALLVVPVRRSHPRVSPSAAADRSAELAVSSRRAS